MRIRSTISKIIPVVITMLLLWGFYFVGRSFLSSPKNQNLNYFPDNVDWLVQIDGNKILSDGTLSLLIENPDNELISLIEEKIYNSQNSDQADIGMGVQLNSTIIGFGIPSKKSSITAFLVNLTDPDEFLNNEISFFESANLTINKDRNVGLILFSSKGNTDPNEFQEVSDNIFSNDTDKNGKNESTYPTQSLIFQSNTDHFLVNEFEFDIKESRFDLSGVIDLSEQLKEETELRLIPKEFSIFTQIIPKQINDSLCDFLGTTTPLVGLSLNYAGANLKSLEKIALQINSEILLHFKDSLDFNELFEKLLKRQKIDSLSSDQMTVYGVNYYYHILDNNTLYIGNHPFDPSDLIIDDRLISINGKPSILTKIEGDGIAHKLLGLISIYSASKELSNSMNLIKLEAKYTPKNIIELNGSITFSKEKTTYNELLRFLINSDLFE